MKLEEGKSASSHIDNDDPGPCIMHIGPSRAHQSDPNQEGYAATKSGLLGLTHIAHECKEGDEKGIEWVSLDEEKDMEDYPTDIADAAEYLVNADFVNG
ncbi:hypothetical protein F4782DRAFT_552017 [Xylaria castorea]|nr:hypothetical protein F4782DRAFT_552017 [Xylaria castorea]